ncbi:glycosyltransferase family 2 protein, partial [Streptococcus sp. DD11]
MDYLVIPAYEPDHNLLRLIRKVKNKHHFHVIVINDGSSAKCDHIFKEAEHYATVLHHKTNQGKGQALKTAFTFIEALKVYGTVVTADADGQHKVWDIFRVAAKAAENPNQLVLGARAFTGKVPLRSRFGNSLTRTLFKLQTG